MMRDTTGPVPTMPPPSRFAGAFADALAGAAPLAAAALAVALAAGTGCARPPSEPAASTVPLFEGTGTHVRPVTTTSPEAQRYFDQGLNFLYAFNHDEAIRSFRRAAEIDPACAMAWWGIAIANGPHINYPTMDEARSRAAWEALERARRHQAGARPVDRALIAALGRRYAWPQPADRKPLDAAYAEAMREVHRDHPDDADAGALFAEALMDLRPWDLWTADGAPQPGTEEILATLEGVLARAPDHPLANHLYIHAVEASPHPEKADAAADRLRDLTPGLGHLVHMPSHIDVLRGRWEEAILANARAQEADRTYRGLSPRQDFYRVYMAHNHHMLAFAAMMVGRSGDAVGAIRTMVGEMPEDWVRENPAFADGFVGAPFEVLMRFGRWDEILAEPEPPAHLPIARALRRYARSVARAARNEVAEARAEQTAFRAAAAALPEGSFFGNNAARDLLGVAEHLLEGEILTREGKTDAAIAALREAVRREDALRYNEPPDWIQPVRHALGAVLLKAGRFAEAGTVYRDDLARRPGNGWSLFGLAQSLRLQKKDVEAGAVETRFKAVWSKADVPLSSSCFCQPGV
jgi:tetratricopeptide (TPR) repeat protein